MDELLLPTRINVNVDLHSQGKNNGFLGLIHSDGSAIEYGFVPIPISVINNGSGPTVLVTAGTHGDEYEGQLLLHELARELDPSTVTGRLIIMPALNLPAVLNSSRCSPIDGGNLNRAYPGDPDGSPTFQISDYITRYLLPECDFAADLHSGGLTTEFFPCGFMTRMPHGRNTAAQVSALNAFGMPYTVVYDESIENRAIDSACDQAGVVMVSTELSGAGTVNVETLRHAKAGLMRMLAHWKVIDVAPMPNPGTTFVDVNSAHSHVIATTPGLFEPNVVLGQQVSLGDVVGWIYCVDDLEKGSTALHAHMDGIVYTKRVPPLVRRGNIVCSLGTEVSETEL